MPYEEVGEAVDQSALTLVLLSPGALEREEVLFPLQIAMTHKRRIILYHDLCRDPQRLALPPREVRNDILYFGPNPNPNWVGGSR